MKFYIYHLYIHIVQVLQNWRFIIIQHIVSNVLRSTLLSLKAGCKCFTDNNRCFGWYDKGLPSNDTHNKADIFSKGHKTECSIRQLYDKSNSVKHSKFCIPVLTKIIYKYIYALIHCTYIKIVGTRRNDILLPSKFSM